MEPTAPTPAAPPKLLDRLTPSGRDVVLILLVMALNIGLGLLWPKVSDTPPPVIQPPPAQPLVLVLAVSPTAAQPGTPVAVGRP